MYNKRIFLMFMMFTFIMFLCFALTSILNEKTSIYFEVLSGLAAVVGVCAIWIEMRREKDLRESQFIIDLNQSFYNNEDIKSFYERLHQVYYATVNGQPIESFSDSFSEKDELFISQYLSFFGTINYLIERNMIELKMIDTTFSYRYFLLMNNPIIQDLFVIKDAQFYRGNYCLYDKWLTYRENNNSSIPFSNFSLKERHDDFHSIVKDYQF